MPIVFGTLVVWVAVTVFCLVPKKLTPFDMIFLFFINTVFELGTFAVLHGNLKLIQVGPGGENALVDLMFRLLELPLFLVTTSNLMLHAGRFAKWGGISAIFLFTLLVQAILVWQGMLIFRHWSLLYSALYMVVFIAFSRAMAWVIMRTSPDEVL